MADLPADRRFADAIRLTTRISSRLLAPGRQSRATMRDLNFPRGPLAAFLACTLLLAGAAAQDLPKPTPSPLVGLGYSETFFPGATYDQNVPTPSSVLGFEVGSK